jgi:Icc-related predicted phosphoesterase
MRLVLISDTHGDHDHLSVPDGDVLIHAGDMTDNGEVSEVRDFNRWLGTLPHKHKLVIAGNHDFCLADGSPSAWELLSHATYLQDQAVVIASMMFYGSPWQPSYCDMAFNLSSDAQLQEKWSLIPQDTDVLITHCPPHGILDVTMDDHEHIGCKMLRPLVLNWVKPRLHVFGHVHEQHGNKLTPETLFVNASICGDKNIGIWPPIVVELG